MVVDVPELKVVGKEGLTAGPYPAKVEQYSGR